VLLLVVTATEAASLLEPTVDVQVLARLNAEAASRSAAMPDCSLP
jgi:hypothetical protein